MPRPANPTSSPESARHDEDFTPHHPTPARTCAPQVHIAARRQTVLIDNTTRFDNGIVPVAGDYVDVHGLVAGDGSVAAGFVQKKATLAIPPFVELERRSLSSDTRLILKGPVCATSGTSTLTILGVVVDTGTVAEADFRSLADAAIGRAAFFAALAASNSTAVKARGTVGAGGAVRWEQMELED